MDKTKAKRTRMDICDILDGITKEELNKPSIVEHYKNLAKLNYYIGKLEENEQKEEYSQRIGRAYAPYESYRDGIEWGAYADGSMRGRDAMGRYTSGDSYRMTDPKDQLRMLMQNPDMSYEAKEHLRKAMEAVR